MRYGVCYIDDRIIPHGGIVSNETSLISKNEIVGLINNDEWEEPTVRRFLKHTIAKSNKFKQIELSGFTHPAFFLNYAIAENYNPNSIILDWDYGDSKAEERIEEILNTTSSKIFVLTGNELESDVENLISPIREKYPHRVKEVYSKSIHKEDKNTQENLLEEIISDLTSISEEYNYNGLTIRFSPSSILPNFEAFWMVESILSSEFIKKYAIQNVLEISLKTIEKMFEDSNVSFYINSKNTRIYSENGRALAEFYGDDNKITIMKAIYAIKNYELPLLETAFEKGTSKTFQNYER
jgi:hypothetical protein